MFKPSHLTDEAANVLTGAIDERVYFVQSKRWIAYPKAVLILDHLNKLLTHPRTTRMPSRAEGRMTPGIQKAGAQTLDLRSRAESAAARFSRPKTA